MTTVLRRFALALTFVLTVLSGVEVQTARVQQRTRLRGGRAGAAGKPMRVVVTLSDYAALTRIVGGERVTRPGKSEKWTLAIASQPPSGIKLNGVAPAPPEPTPKLPNQVQSSN